MASGYYKVKETAGKVVDDAEHPFDRDIARIDHLEREAEDGTLFKEHPDIVKQQGLEGKDPGKVKEGGTLQIPKLHLGSSKVGDKEKEKGQGNKK